MANIRLADIPNAPQVGGAVGLNKVAMPVDQVGNKAIGQIRQGYQGAMQSIDAATAPGRAGAAVGRNIAVAGNNMNRATHTYVRQAKAKAETQAIYNASMINAELEPFFAQANPTMHPSIVAAAYADKQKVFSGISNWSQQFAQNTASLMEARAMSRASTRASIYVSQKNEAQNDATLEMLLMKGDFPTAEIAVQAMEDAGVPPPKVKKYRMMIESGRATKKVQDLIQFDPEGMSKVLMDAFLAGEIIENIGPGLDHKSYLALSKFADSVADRQTVAKIQMIGQEITTGIFTTVDQLMENPEFNSLDETSQKVLIAAMADSFVGTPQGTANHSSAQEMVNSFPNPDSPIPVHEQYREIVQFITGSVPGQFQELLLETIGKTAQTLTDNNGILPPSNRIRSSVSQTLTNYMNAGVFGRMPTEEEKKKNPRQYYSDLNARQRTRDSILEDFDNQEGIRSLPQALQWLDKTLADDKAKAAADEADGSDGGGFWNYLFPSRTPADKAGEALNIMDNPQASVDLPSSNAVTNQIYNGVATWFAWSPNGERDELDNQEGKYGDTSTAEKEGVALSVKTLKSFGIDPNNRKQVAQYNVAVTANGMTKNFPIVDLGPHPDVEAKKGAVVDMTGAAFSSMNLKGNEPITWKLVPS